MACPGISGSESLGSLRSRWRLELQLKDTLLRLQSSPPHAGGSRCWLTVTVSQLLSRVQLFAISWTVAHQAPLSSPISCSLLKFMAIDLVMLSNYPILCCPLLLFVFHLSRHPGFFLMRSHEIKRRLLLGRKVMTNLDSIFKSRDITLPTKFRLVKATVFPVVMYGCEIWTMKKAES